MYLGTGDLAAVLVPCLPGTETDDSAKGKNTGRCALHHHVAFLEVCDHGIEVATASTLATAADHVRHRAGAGVPLRVRTTQRTILICVGDCPTKFRISRFWFSTRAYLGELSLLLSAIQH